MTMRERLARAKSPCEYLPFNDGNELEQKVDQGWTDWLRYADAVLAEIAAAGMVLVPREPTEAMMEAAIFRSSAIELYRAMLSAAGGE